MVKPGAKINNEHIQNCIIIEYYIGQTFQNTSEESRKPVDSFLFYASVSSLRPISSQCKSLIKTYKNQHSRVCTLTGNGRVYKVETQE